tara:strand:- start:2029 stop:2166 length:138 start_codon:yes stop_codon:yes gene_type:complete
MVLFDCCLVLFGVAWSCLVLFGVVWCYFVFSFETMNLRKDGKNQQ